MIKTSGDIKLDITMSDGTSASKTYLFKARCDTISGDDLDYECVSSCSQDYTPDNSRGCSGTQKCCSKVRLGQYGTQPSPI